ncbi:TPA: hypothetical protein ACGX6L_002121 [Listeria monocytogenes]
MTIDVYNPTLWDDEKPVYPEDFTKWEQQFKKIVDELNRHMSIRNDHNLTKADLALGNVNNFGLASTEEAKSGTNPQKYMTPSLTAEAIRQIQAIKSINGRTGTVLLTKADVQLSNVSDYPLATKELAETGSSSTHYMTPLTTKQAIDNIAQVIANKARDEAMSASVLKKGNSELNGILSFDIAKVSPAPIYDASNVADMQSWARGFGVRTGEQRLAEMGISGVGKTVNSMYMGFGASPWQKANSLFVDNNLKNMSIFGNEIETVAGAQAKVTQSLSEAKAYMDSKEMTSSSVLDIIKNQFKTQNVLFEGAAWPAPSVYAFAKEQKISDQNQGVVLIWSDYDVFTNGNPSVANNYNFDFTFIPKFFIEKHSGANLNVPVATNINSTTAFITIKTLYLTDTTFAGNDSNRTGVNATDAILRYIVGV